MEEYQLPPHLCTPPLGGSKMTANGISEMACLDRHENPVDLSGADILTLPLVPWDVEQGELVKSDS